MRRPSYMHFHSFITICTVVICFLYGVFQNVSHKEYCSGTKSSFPILSVIPPPSWKSRRTNLIFQYCLAVFRLGEAEDGAISTSCDNWRPVHRLPPKLKASVRVLSQNCACHHRKTGLGVYHEGVGFVCLSL